MATELPQAPLRSWFAWRFSLTRLVVAVVFLGVVVGLTVCGPRVHLGDTVYRFYGWPLPCAITDHEASGVECRSVTIEQLQAGQWAPPTHLTYNLVPLFQDSWASKPIFEWGSPDSSGSASVVCVAIDVLFALTFLALILFLQIPRRKVVAKVE